IFAAFSIVSGFARSASTSALTMSSDFATADASMPIRSRTCSTTGEMVSLLVGAHEATSATSATVALQMVGQASRLPYTGAFADSCAIEVEPLVHGRR